MFQDKKNKLVPRGDYVAVNESVMDKEWEVRSRCESVHDVVTQRIIPLSKDLKAYDITLEQYFGFLMIKSLKVKIIMDAMTIGTLLKVVLGFMDIPNTGLDAKTQQLVEDMRRLSAVS